jgi:hypothetical protein
MMKEIPASRIRRNSEWVITSIMIKPFIVWQPGSEAKRPGVLGKSGEHLPLPTPDTKEKNKIRSSR